MHKECLFIIYFIIFTLYVSCAVYEHHQEHKAPAEYGHRDGFTLQIVRLMMGK
jgi:hypothetical protein